jgi:hypothetical protein
LTTSLHATLPASPVRSTHNQGDAEHGEGCPGDEASLACDLGNLNTGNLQATTTTDTPLKYRDSGLRHTEDVAV